MGRKNTTQSALKKSSNIVLKKTQSKFALQRLFDNLRESKNDNSVVDQAPQCVFLGALCLKPVPDIFQVTLQPITLRQQSNKSILCKNIRSRTICDRGNLNKSRKRKNSTEEYRKSSTYCPQSAAISNNFFIRNITDQKSENKILKLFGKVKQSIGEEIMDKSKVKEKLKEQTKSRNDFDDKNVLRQKFSRIPTKTELFNNKDSAGREFSKKGFLEKSFLGNKSFSELKITMPSERFRDYENLFDKDPYTREQSNTLNSNIQNNSVDKDIAVENVIRQLRQKKNIEVKKVNDMDSKLKRITPIIEDTPKTEGYDQCKSFIINLDPCQPQNTFMERNIYPEEKETSSESKGFLELEEDEIEDYLEIDQNIVEDLEALIPEEEIESISNSLIQPQDYSLEDSTIIEENKPENIGISVETSSEDIPIPNSSKDTRIIPEGTSQEIELKIKNDKDNENNADLQQNVQDAPSNDNGIDTSIKVAHESIMLNNNESSPEIDNKIIPQLLTADETFEPSKRTSQEDTPEPKKRKTSPTIEKSQLKKKDRRSNRLKLNPSASKNLRKITDFLIPNSIKTDPNCSEEEKPQINEIAIKDNSYTATTGTVEIGSSEIIKSEENELPCKTRTLRSRSKLPLKTKDPEVRSTHENKVIQKNNKEQNVNSKGSSISISFKNINEAKTQQIGLTYDNKALEKNNRAQHLNSELSSKLLLENINEPEVQEIQSTYENCIISKLPLEAINELEVQEIKSTLEITVGEANTEQNLNPEYSLKYPLKTTVEPDVQEIRLTHVNKVPEKNYEEENLTPKCSSSVEVKIHEEQSKATENNLYQNICTKESDNEIPILEDTKLLKNTLLHTDDNIQTKSELESTVFEHAENMKSTRKSRLSKNQEKNVRHKSQPKRGSKRNANILNFFNNTEKKKNTLQDKEKIMEISVLDPNGKAISSKTDQRKEVYIPESTIEAENKSEIIDSNENHVFTGSSVEKEQIVAIETSSEKEQITTLETKKVSTQRERNFTTEIAETLFEEEKNTTESSTETEQICGASTESSSEKVQIAVVQARKGKQVKKKKKGTFQRKKKSSKIQVEPIIETKDIITDEEGRKSGKNTKVNKIKVNRGKKGKSLPQNRKGNNDTKAEKITENLENNKAKVGAKNREKTLQIYDFDDLSSEEEEEPPKKLAKKRKFQILTGNGKNDLKRSSKLSDKNTSKDLNPDRSTKKQIEPENVNNNKPDTNPHLSEDKPLVDLTSEDKTQHEDEKVNVDSIDTTAGKVILKASPETEKETDEFGQDWKPLYGPYKRIDRCNVCLVAFKSYKKLRAHKKIHEVENPYKCTVCDDCFEDVEKLAAHLRIHKGKMPYPCKKCDATFWTSFQLERHQLVHVLKKVPPPAKPPSKVFKCEECGKVFKKICDLERHTRVHTGEKPSVCNICNKRFQQSYNLNKHLYTHTQEKNFECVICQKKFGRNDVLNRHVLTHSIVKPFRCSVCSRTFIRNSQLKLHLRKHHGLDEDPGNETNTDDPVASTSTKV